MRLSTEQDRDETRAIELLHTAFDGGVTFLDTADAYCLNDDDIGHNERLISRALASWSGDRYAHRRCDERRPDSTEWRVGAKRKGPPFARRV